MDESIDAQIRAIEEYASKNNIQIVKVFADRAKSATSANRPEFQNMIKYCEADDTGISMVMVHKLDRFSRDKYDSAMYKQKLKVKGIRVVSVLENLDNSPESVILESVIEGMAQYYSANLAREVAKGQKENALKALHNGGDAPLGYDVAFDKTYVINEEEAQAVKIIFDMYINGYSYSNIIDKLNDLRGVIVFTDPDYNGERIRKIIMEAVPTAKHAFLNRGEATPKSKTKGRSLGVEHASFEDLQKALSGVLGSYDDDNQFDISKSNLMKLGLLMGADSRKRREYLGEALRIGYCNGKQLLKRLELFGITLEELEEVMAKY